MNGFIWRKTQQKYFFLLEVLDQIKKQQQQQQNIRHFTSWKWLFLVSEESSYFLSHRSEKLGPSMFHLNVMNKTVPLSEKYGYHLWDSNIHISVVSMKIIKAISLIFKYNCMFGRCKAENNTWKNLTTPLIHRIIHRL